MINKNVEGAENLFSPEVLLVPVLPDPEVWCTDFIRLRVRRDTKLIWAQLFMSFSFLSLFHSIYASFFLLQG